MTAQTTRDAYAKERAWLGYAGLLPFLIGLAMLLATDNPTTADLATDALRYYAAVIASFLGAVHWGVFTKDLDRRRVRLRWGVVPALSAWVLLFVPAEFGLLGFALLFVVILVVDLRMPPLPDTSYQKLRLRLSMAVVMTLLIAALILDRHKHKSWLETPGCHEVLGESTSPMITMNPASFEISPA